MGKKGMFTIAQRKDVVNKLQGVKICPVTNGLPSTMTAKGFAEACERAQLQDRQGYAGKRAYKFTLCDACQGKRPPRELTIVSLGELAEKEREKGKEPENARTFPGRKKGAKEATQYVPRRRVPAGGGN